MVTALSLLPLQPLVPLLSVSPPLRISVCRLRVSDSLHFAIYPRRPGEAKELRVRVGECMEKQDRERGGGKIRGREVQKVSEIQSQFRTQYPQP